MEQLSRERYRTMITNLPNQYRASTRKISDNLLAEQIKPEINWHTIDLIGRELIVLAGEARKE